MVVSAWNTNGGCLVIFYLNPWDTDDEMPEGGGPPFGVNKEELDSLFTAHFDLVEELKPTTAYPGRDGREVVRLLRKIRRNGERANGRTGEAANRISTSD